MNNDNILDIFDSFWRKSIFHLISKWLGTTDSMTKANPRHQFECKLEIPTKSIDQIDKFKHPTWHEFALKNYALVFNFVILNLISSWSHVFCWLSCFSYYFCFHEISTFFECFFAWTLFLFFIYFSFFVLCFFSFVIFLLHEFTFSPESVPFVFLYIYFVVLFATSLTLVLCLREI